ncbi:MAG: 2-oxo acid dehydrogenase subunit E2, partial [Alphaproteobacteria bacterium]
PPAAPQAVAAAPAPSPAPPAIIPAPPAAPAAPPHTNGQGGRILVSPLARRMAEQAGIALGGLAGSGPGGRIVKADIETALKAPSPAGVPAPVIPGQPAPGAEPTLIAHSGVRKIIAARLSEADRDIPQFYLTVDCEIDRLLAARQEINEAAPDDPETGKPAYRVSVNDMVIKAAAAALGRVPAVNAAWSEAAVIRYNTIDVAVAVAIPDGLITPIIRGADHKGLAAISAEMKVLAGRAKDGKLMPEEYQGGGFTLSNLGMFGIKDFTSIVNPPQACILAVAVGEARAVVRDGAVVVRTMMSVTLTCDHRVVDGATGATWLQAFKGFIEAPARMLA